MNILIIPIGSHGDVHPLAALGLALHERGHRVTVVTNPHFEGLVQRIGLPFVALGTEVDYRRAIENPGLWKPMDGFRIVITATHGMMRPLMDIIRAHDEPGETVMVAPRTAIGARIAQEVWGIPLVTVDLQPAMIRSAIEPPVLPMYGLVKWLPPAARRWFYRLGDRRVVDPLAMPPINALRAELGLPPASGFLDWWASPQCILGLYPDWFAPPQADWPPQITLSGFPLFDESFDAGLDPEVDRFLAAGAPPIVFTAGSAMQHGAAFFRAAVEACSRLGRRGLLLARFGDQIPRGLPEGVQHFTYVPFSQVLPRAAALVHHGGVGTCAQGLAAGIPQLVMPLAHDQPDNAMRLERLGVGRTLPPSKFVGPAVARQLASLLDSTEAAAQARELATRMDRRASLGQACAVIEQIRDSRPAADRAGAALGAAD